MKLKNIIFIFTLIFYTTDSVFAGFGGNIGTFDRRANSSLDDPNYRGIVRFNIGNNSTCTGGFVAPNLVITNRHCAIHCIGNKKANCSISFFDGTTIRDNVKLIAHMKPNDHETLNGRDWTLFLVDTDSQYYKSIAPQSPTNINIRRGGFGTLRVISDDELPKIKQITQQVYKNYLSECKTKSAKNPYACLNRHLDRELAKHNIKPIFGDGKQFKVQTCTILGKNPQHPTMLKTNCDSAGGDSGAPLLYNGQIVGLNNSGPQNIFNNDDNYGANALNTNNFYRHYQKFLSYLEQQKPTKTRDVLSLIHESFKFIPINSEDIDNTDENTQTLLEYMDQFKCE